MKSKYTVRGLRQEGYKVRVYHKRMEAENGELKPTGGETQVEITDPNGTSAQGTALCSKKDVYNKKLGVAIAIGRAMKCLKS